MLMNVTWLQYLMRHYWVLFGVLFFSHTAQASLQVAIDELLIKAREDLKANRLLTPVGNNAVDRYRAVLLLDKTNQQAALGLRGVADRYLQLSQTYASRQQFLRARQMVKNAITVNGRTVATANMSKAIRRAEQKVRQVQKPPLQPSTVAANDDLNQATFILNSTDLKARNQAVVEQLASLGKRVKETREYVSIYARNDDEGRWIYQQMRQASTGYRLRGNIKRHGTPRIVLEEPLD
jgi:multidrug resistance efflux pump